MVLKKLLNYKTIYVYIILAIVKTNNPSVYIHAVSKF